MERAIEIRLHDTSVHIWQDDPNDPTFRSEIFIPLLRRMRCRGWAITADQDILKRYRSISPNFRNAAKGNMRARLSIAGRHIEVEFWSESSRQDNSNGRQYDFDKLDRMPYLDKKRFELERSKLLALLTKTATATISHSRRSNRSLPALERIAADYAESWHSDKALGRPVCKYENNARSADGGLIEHGRTVWYRGEDGRWRRGQAFYNINNMWWVVESEFALRNMASFDLHRHPPSDLREKRNDRLRRQRLESKMAKAVMASDFARAAVIKDILFGNSAPHLIWSRKNDCYYGPTYQGYTNNAMNAGRYTRAEAEAECRRVPHILEMVCPDGKRVRFDSEAAA